MSKLNQSFIRLNTDGLEVQGLAGGGMAHVRFRLQDILGVEIGYRQESLAGALPSVRAIRSNALVIREKSGAVISFELAGVLFRSEDLTRLLATLAPLIGK